MAKIVSRGDPIEPVYLNNLRVAAHDWGAIYGLTVSERGAGANMSVDVAAGYAWINVVKVSKTSTTNVAITAAHASYDRYDLVVINSSGTISVIDGTAAATSYANDYDLETNNAILLAEVYVPATDTTIEDAQITDKRILIDPVVVFVGVEEYSNHLGATDNFTQTHTTGNGTATADTTNHEMDLSCGLTVVGMAAFETKKQWTISAKPLVCNFLVQNINVGAGGTERGIAIGLKDDFTHAVGSPYAVFEYDEDDDIWETRSYNSGLEENTISDIVNGDFLTIVATSSNIKFYVNGALVSTHISQIPSSGTNAGAKVSCISVAVTTAVQISIDMMGIKAYH